MQGPGSAMRTACCGLVPTFVSDANPGCLFSLSKSRPLFSFVASTNSCRHKRRGWCSAQLKINSLWDCTKVITAPSACRLLGSVFRPKSNASQAATRSQHFFFIEPQPRKPVARALCRSSAHLRLLLQLVQGTLLCPHDDSPPRAEAAEGVGASRWASRGACNTCRRGQRGLGQHCVHHCECSSS